MTRAVVGIRKALTPTTAWTCEARDSRLEMNFQRTSPEGRRRVLRLAASRDVVAGSVPDGRWFATCWRCRKRSGHATAASRLRTIYRRIRRMGLWVVLRRQQGEASSARNLDRCCKTRSCSVWIGDQGNGGWGTRFGSDQAPCLDWPISIHSIPARKTAPHASF